MDAFLDLLKFIFFGLLISVVAVTMVCWLVASLETLHYTKQNNVLLRGLCVENGLNVDSIDGKLWLKCVQYEGNEHLVGTTKNPE